MGTNLKATHCEYCEYDTCFFWHGTPDPHPPPHPRFVGERGLTPTPTPDLPGIGGFTPSPTPDFKLPESGYS